MSADEDAELAELWPIFLEDTPEWLTGLTAAIRAEDSPLAVRLAHTIKGEARTMRLAELANLAEQAEAEAAAGRFGPAAELAARLVATFARLTAERGG